MEMSRSDFLRLGLMAAGLSFTAEGQSEDMDAEQFRTYQDTRRKELWGLLGDLPEKREPQAKLRKKEKHDGFTLEHLELDLNGEEIAPAYLLIPDNLKAPAPGMMYIHWHGGDYGVGKDELLRGTRAMQPYAPVYAEKGIVALSIDSWCFGERVSRPENGGWGESDRFKDMLWKGQVLYGMMMYDEWQALNYLCSRPEVDTNRLGSFGMSMGSTKSWWLAALDERIKCCMDLCCLTDFEALIEANKDFDLILFPNRRHGFGSEPYMMRRRWDYFVKNLLGAEPPKEFEFSTLGTPRMPPA